MSETQATFEIDTALFMKVFKIFFLGSFLSVSVGRDSAIDTSCCLVGKFYLRGSFR